MREQKKHKNRGGLQNGQRCFFGPCLGFGGFVFWFSLCFCASVLYTIAQNVYFLACLEVFCLFCSHKRPVLNCLFSSYFVFFAFVFPFKNPFSSSCFLSINPLLEKTLCGISFVFLLLAFPFLMFACLFETNIPNIPFLKPKLLSLLAIYFFLLLFLFLFSWCMFQPFCFYVGFVFGILLFFICVFVFVLLLVLLSIYEKKKLFSCNSGVLDMLLRRVVCFLLCFMFLFLFVFLCCLFPFIEFICIILFLCCCFCHKAKWSSCLHLVVLLPFLFFVVLFWICFLFFSFLSKKRPPKNRTQQKPKNAKMQKNGQKTVSAIVFTNSVLYFLGWD